MVKVELSYNPYLLETIVKFNDQDPKINSLVEKYQEGKLQQWIDKLPQVFHDEMNGYDFELIFSGTEDDFNSVKNSFETISHKDSEIEFFYKNELESPELKNRRIRELLNWLSNNNNRRFDFDAFQNDNANLLDSPYSFITVHGMPSNEIVISDETIFVENVDDVNELSNTDLNSTPIVLFVDSKNLDLLKYNIEFLINRNDVSKEQIFFYINPELDHLRIERIILDLGIKNPQIVKSLDDDKIFDYFKVYPLTEYIHEFLSCMRQASTNIQNNLEVEIEHSKVVNSEIHLKMDALEDDIRQLKQSLEWFVQRDNLFIPNAYNVAKERFENSVYEWRRKKTKTTNFAEAEKMAMEFSAELTKYYYTFINDIAYATSEKRNDINNDFRFHYEAPDIDTGFNPSVSFSSEIAKKELPSLYAEFLELKNEMLVDAKTELKDFFKVNDAPKDKVLEVTYSYDDWRNKAYNDYMPIIESILITKISELNEYYDKLAHLYEVHINELIEMKTIEKNAVAEQLSDDERRLQIDSDWLSELVDMINVIERG